MTNEIEKTTNLKNIAKFLRKSALGTILNVNNGHIGGCMSSVELFTALYFGGDFKFDIGNPKNENRDRVLVRGHMGPLRYSIFSLLGYISEEELKTYRTFGSRLQGHEDMDVCPGVDITPSGSLGMLLSYGVGSAIANKNKGLDARTVVFLGDGEEQEGNVSEAARHATSIGLNNLICILDKNKKQLSGATVYMDGASDIKKIWEGYGWDVIEIEDGNDIEQVSESYKKLKNINKPTLIIANTEKGYGLTLAKEHPNGFHTLSSATADEKTFIKMDYEKMLEELKDMGIDFISTAKLAKEMTVKPTEVMIKEKNIDSKLFEVHTTETGTNVGEADIEYILDLKQKVLDSNNGGKIYFVTPDIITKREAEDIGYTDFCHYMNTGIREQHTVAMCHGISQEDPKARIVIKCMDAFLYRSLDQLYVTNMGRSNIVFIGNNSGIFASKGGKTHQSVSQPGAVLAIPRVETFEPADSVDLYNVFSQVLSSNKGVSYIRQHDTFTKIEVPNSVRNTLAYTIYDTLKDPDLVMVSSGFMAENATEAAKLLEKEYELAVRVINLININRFEKLASELLTNEAPIITLYNGNPQILSQCVANAILSNPNIPRPKFIEGHGFTEGTTGSASDLIKHFGFDADGIKKFAIDSLSKHIELERADNILEDVSNLEYES